MDQNKPKKEFAMNSTWSGKNNPTFFFEDDPPSWLISKENNWFWEEHVLTLEKGKSVSTDFQKITRIS